MLNIFEDLDQDGTADHFDDDIDGDGFTNSEELAYGSDPRSSATLPLNDSNFMSAINLWFDAERNATALYGHISDWNVSSVTNMTGAFSNRMNFNEDISKWDTSLVTRMDNMFSGASSFNQPIGEWNTSSVRLMYQMFNGATSFNQDISEWNTSSVTSIYGMFRDASSFNEPIGGWDTSSVKKMGSMFCRASLFNQSLSDWNTSAVTNMGSMFLGASSFDQSLAKWNVSSVEKMNGMFFEASSLSNLSKREIHRSFSANENWPYDWSPQIANSAPIDLNTTTELSVTENNTVGRVLGRFTASDPESDAITFSLVQTQGSEVPYPFQMEQNGALRTTRIFDYETDEHNYYITVVAKDEYNATSEGNFTVTIIDQNEAPYDLNATAPLRVQENQSAGTIVGKLIANDQDEGDQLSYKLVRDREQIDNELFALDENGTLSTAATFDYEKNQAFHIRVKVLDQSGLMAKESFYISVINIVEDLDGDGTEDAYDWDIDGDGFTNEEESAYGSDPFDSQSVINVAPTDIIIKGGEIEENQPADTLVARFIGVDADKNDSFSYQLIDSVNNEDFPFKLSPRGGLRTTRKLDYESDMHNYSLTIRVMDDLNESFDKLFVVNLINQIEDLDGDGTEDAYDDDLDGDGFSNEQEREIGTNPTDRYSRPGKTNP